MHTTSSEIELSLIVPCYNSSVFLEKELPIIINFLESNYSEFELILVDDGSNKEDRDRVAHLAQKYKSVVFIKQPQNMGKGAALRRGFGMAKGRVKIFTDSDFPFEHQVISTIYHKICGGSVDMVIGDRTNPQSEYYLQVGWLRRFGSYLIAGIGNRLLENNIIDTQCGIKGFSAYAADYLFPNSIINGFGIDFEILLMASGGKMRIEKIPVKLRTNYPSSVNVLKDGSRILVDICRAVIYHAKKKNRR